MCDSRLAACKIMEILNFSINIAQNKKRFKSRNFTVDWLEPLCLSLTHLSISIQEKYLSSNGFCNLFHLRLRQMNAKEEVTPIAIVSLTRLPV